MKFRNDNNINNKTSPLWAQGFFFSLSRHCLYLYRYLRHNNLNKRYKLVFIKIKAQEWVTIIQNW